MNLRLSFLIATVVATVLFVVGGTMDAAANRPTLVSCGAGTHAVVHHPIVNGVRVRRVVCVKNTIVHRRMVGTTGARTLARCGPGTHAVIHHPIVNGVRVRRVVCVRNSR
jgi:hypothetical protein